LRRDDFVTAEFRAGAAPKFLRVGAAPVTRANLHENDESTTSLCRIARVKRSAICVANSINHAYEIAKMSSVKIAFQTFYFGN
jgi:L-lysine 2,3-aminomutase